MGRSAKDLVHCVDRSDSHPENGAVAPQRVGDTGVSSWGTCDSAGQPSVANKTPAAEPDAGDRTPMV
jgi:hypothetical protein